MAYTETPLDLFPGLSENGTHLSIPISSLPGLTAAESDEDTGDAREMARAFIERIFQWYAGLAAANRPTAMSVGLSPLYLTTGDYANKIQMRYTITFIVEPPASQVVDEVISA